MSNTGNDDEELPRLVDELLQRLRRGEHIDWPAWFRRYPRHADELQRLAGTMEALVKVLVNQADSLQTDLSLILIE